MLKSGGWRGAAFFLLFCVASSCTGLYEGLNCDVDSAGYRTCRILMYKDRYTNYGPLDSVVHASYSWLGRPVGDLLRSWGRPDRILEKEWAFKNFFGGFHKSFPDVKFEKKEGDKIYEWNYYQENVLDTFWGVYTRDCYVRFLVDKNDLIVMTDFDQGSHGDGCRIYGMDWSAKVAPGFDPDARVGHPRLNEELAIQGLKPEAQAAESTAAEPSKKSKTAAKKKKAGN